MNFRIVYLLKNIGLLAVSNFSSKILVFLLVPLYTRVLSTDEYGVFDLVYSTILLLCPILTLNIADAVMRFTMEKDYDVNEVAVIGFRVLATGLVPVVIFLVGCCYWGWIEEIKGLEILILFYFVFYCTYQFMIQLAKGAERVLEMSIAGVLSTFFLLVSNIFFLLVIKNGLWGFYVANVIAQAVPTFYLCVKLKVWEYPLMQKIDKTLYKKMLLYCTPLIVTAVGWWVNNASNKYIIAFMCGTAANGLLSVAYKIPSIINVFQNIFMQAWQISAIKEYGCSDNISFYGKTFSVFCVFMGILCSILIILTKPIGYVMYSKDFFQAWHYVPFLLLSCVFNAAAGFMGPILTAKLDSRSMAVSAIYGSVANIVICIVLANIIGVQGATIATAISSFIIYVYRKKSVGNEIKIERYGVILLTWCILCLQAIIEVYTSFWFIEILLMLVMIIINWNGLNEIFKMLLTFIVKLGFKV